MKLKIAVLAGVLATSLTAGASHAANSHLGVIPFENLFDVSFIRASGGNNTKTLREGGVVVSTYTNALTCSLLSRAFVITDAQLNVVLQDDASATNASPMIYAVNGANMPVPLASGSPDDADYYQVTQFQQNLTGGVAMPAGSHICISGSPTAKYNWFEGRVSGYYPSK